MSKFNDSLSIIKNILNSETIDTIKNSELLAEKEFESVTENLIGYKKESLQNKTKRPKKYVPIGRQKQDLVQGQVAVINKITGIRSVIFKEIFDPEIHFYLSSRKYYFNCQHKITKKYKFVHIYDLNNSQFHINEYDIIDIEKYNALYEQFKEELNNGKSI